MSQTTYKANASTADATPTPGRHRSQVLPAIALVVATVAAVLSVIAITTTNTGSPTPPQPAAQQQSVPAAGESSRPRVAINVDDCGRPYVTGRMACR